MNNTKKIYSMQWMGTLVVILTVLCLCLGMSNPVWAAKSTGNNFTMLSGVGGAVGGTNDVVFTWDGTLNSDVATAVVNATITSNEPFFGSTWNAHDVQIFGPGSYTFNASNTGDPGGPFLTMTVGPNQIGAHMFFDWSVNPNIDVVNVWDRNAVFAPSAPHTGADNGSSCAPATVPCDGSPNQTTDVWDLMSTDNDGDGINGVPMVDGGFVGFNANFNLNIDLCAGVTCDDGNPCTVDACNPNNGLCETTNNTAPCDDGDYCTTGDVCSGGVCQAGTPVNCPDDANPCNGTEQCDPGDGSCTSVNPVVCASGLNCDPVDGVCKSQCPDGDGDSFVDCSCAPVGAPCDCDDGNAAVNPDAAEICNGIDDDCDPLTTIAGDVDSDNDGYPVCNGDCDDANASVHPGASEVCNDIDDDCNGQVDDGLTFADYCPDADGDGFGDSSDVLSSCLGTPPVGRIADCGDCDDSSILRKPGLGELCDGIDNDCNNIVDDPDQLTFITYYQDLDGDGFGSSEISDEFCETVPPEGWSSKTGDCSGCMEGDACGESLDQNGSINPNAVEVEGNNIDENCDGSLDAVVPIPQGRYVFDINPDLSDIRAGDVGKPNLKSYFAFVLANKFRAVSTYVDSSKLNNGLPGNSAGLISFELGEDFTAFRQGPDGPEEVTANITVQGLPRGTDNDGNFVYPGDYKIGIFTSPGGDYVHFAQALRTGRYDSATNSLEFFLGEVDPVTGADDVNVFADTQNAGINIVFPYDPIGTETYQNFKPGSVPGGCEITNTVDATISGTKVSYNGKIFLYNGIASFASGLASDTNGDGTIDAKDTLIDANEDGAIDASDIPDDIAGVGEDTNGDGIGDEPDGIVDENDMVDSWHATLATAANVPLGVPGFACIAFVHVYDGLIFPSQNTPPTADVGEDAGAQVGDTVVLDGSGSFDPEDGEVSEYAWELISWPVASRSALIFRDTAAPSITVDAPGEYVASLVVKDSKDASSLNTATVKISVTSEVEGDGFGDIDSDGIPDWQDDCPDDPKVTCKDTDQDGILDSEDNAPNDPAMTIVSEGNCNLLMRVGAGLGGAEGSNKAALRHVQNMGSEGVADLPPESVLLSYDIDVSHPSLFSPEGAEVAVTIEIPCDIQKPIIFKLVDGKVKTLKELGIPYEVDQDGSNTITVTLKDGGPGDDGPVDGIIIDPLGIGEDTSTPSGRGGGGGGCGIAGQADAADAMLLLLPIFALVGTRWARKRIRK